MAELNRAGQVDSLGHIDTTQKTFRQQVDLVADELRQLAGNADLPEDPLSAPYVLYVNGYIGQDTFVGGEYQATTADIERRISLQKLECGYSEARPFKTINRAAIEAAIITSRSWFTTDAQRDRALVSIVVAPGEYIVLNDEGQSFQAGSFPPRESGYEPTDEELIAFNGPTGGVILPRGCSMVSLDLRKTIIRPNYVPPVADEALDYSNRRGIFKLTGQSYLYGYTFKDSLITESSHHLLHCFEFASKDELDTFYNKVLSSFASAGVVAENAVPREGEYEIVGPLPPSPTEDTDTVGSASPYIYNTSVRSTWGMGGVFCDGSKVDGFKSMVIAQFTSVSLQRDMNCWERYSGGSWGAVSSYTDYINLNPDDTRMDVRRRSFHIRAINNAVIQEVSVFAIGQGIHHWTQTGGELTITNSNSNFGGCAALSENYRTYAFDNDKNWAVSAIRVATDLTEKNGNVVKVYLGNVGEGQTDAQIQSQKYFDLRIPLDESLITPGVPKVLDDRKYTFREDSYLWIENPIGEDYRTTIPATAWDAADPDRINFQDEIETETGIAPGDPILTSSGVPTGQFYPSLEDRRVYIRRVRDSRTTDERRYSLIVNSTNPQSRSPVRDYIVQNAESSFPDTAILAVMQVGAEPAAGVGKTANVVVRRNNPSEPWTSGQFYRPGDNITYENKHFMCVKENDSSSFIPTEWNESFVHMQEDYNPEDFLPNAQPEIIFDNDTDGTDASTDLGYDFSTVWSTDPLVQNQYRTATDYRGLHSFLVSVGFSSYNAHTILLPKPTDERDRNPGTALDGIAPPSGAFNAWENWILEFRRPSIIRLFGHAWEWAGYLNYTKAMPQYQQDLSSINRFTYYFTHENGGRVYASGFNQEGFLVTNKGLEDLATGTTLSVEQLGSDDYSIDFPTYYETLSVDNLTVNSQLNLSSSEVIGKPTWQESGANPYLDTVNKISMGPFGGPLPELPLSTQQQEGVIRLATQAEAQAFVRDDLAISPATLIQALGDAVKSVVNARLSLSASTPFPDRNQSGTTLYLHPYNGNEIALYSTITQRWSVRRFGGVLGFSLASAGSSNTNYDIYIYDNTPTDPVSASLRLDFAAWPDVRTPPARSSQDGILTKNGDATRRFIGVVRTTAPGTSIVDLGGVIAPSNSSNYPRLYLGNAYNLYDARVRYFFGSGWTTQTTAWSSPPGYAQPPRCSFVQANTTLVTAFLDEYSNGDGIVYVAPGINTNSGPPDDAFYGEQQGQNQTAGSQWASSLTPGLNEIYYLYRLFGGANNLNEHAAHGMIVTMKS